MPAPDAVSPQTAVLNLTAGVTQVKIGQSRVYALSIITSGPAGSVNDVVANALGGSAVTGAVSIGNQIASIASGATGVINFIGGWPCQAGIAVTVAASAVYALTYS